MELAWRRAKKKIRLAREKKKQAKAKPAQKQAQIQRAPSFKVKPTQKIPDLNNLKKEEEESKKVQPEDLPNESYTFDDLQRVWKAYQAEVAKKQEEQAFREKHQMTDQEYAEFVEKAKNHRGNAKKTK